MIIEPSLQLPMSFLGVFENFSISKLVFYCVLSALVYKVNSRETIVSLSPSHPNTPSGIRSQNYNNQLAQVFDKSMIGDKTMTLHHNTWYSNMTQMTWAFVCFFFFDKKNGAGATICDLPPGRDLIGAPPLRNVGLSHNYYDRAATDLTLAPKRARVLVQCKS